MQTTPSARPKTRRRYTCRGTRSARSRSSDVAVVTERAPQPHDNAARRSSRKGAVLRGRFPRRFVRRADLQVEAVRRRRVVALVGRRVDVAASAGVDARGEAALLELRLHLIGIERRDAERDVADARGARSRVRAAAAIAAAAAPDDDVADLADLALTLAALVGARLPSEQRGVERDALLVIRHFERDV